MRYKVSHVHSPGSSNDSCVQEFEEVRAGVETVRS